MGKKKGRQCGQFQSKSMNAAHRTDWKALASEANGQRRPFRRQAQQEQSRKGYGIQPSSSPSSISCRPSTDGGVGSVATERPRGSTTLGLARLRGILAERLVEDRIHERDARRRRMTSSVVAATTAARQGGRNGGVGSVGEGEVIAGGGKKDRRHDPGWILFRGERDGRGSAAGSRSRGGRFGGSSSSSPRPTIVVPSLQTLAVRSLAPHLNEYVNQCGVSTMHGMLSALPSRVLADLSALHCSSRPDFVGGTTTDEIAYVLGCHGQTEGLALRASNERGDDDGDGDGDDDEEETEEDAFAARVDDASSSSSSRRAALLSRRTLTDDGMLSLVPTLVSTRDDGEDRVGDVCRRRRDPRRGNAKIEPPESWEDNDDAHVTLSGCPNLRRFELVDARRVSAKALSTLLRSCSRVNALSVSGSFDVSCGSELLLHPERGLKSLLPKLKALDLSFCHWVTDALLSGFLRSLLGVNVEEEEAAAAPMFLETINVAGCNAVTKDFLDRTNAKLGFALLSTEVQRWHEGQGSSSSEVGGAR